MIVIHRYETELFSSWVIMYNISMSAFSIKEFYAPYVVCLYLYDFGCEIIFASNNAEKITPLFAKEIITKSSMSDVFYFDDIGQELETTLKEIKKYAENAQIAILIVLGTNTIESELKQLTQTL